MPVTATPAIDQGDLDLDGSCLQDPEALFELKSPLVEIVDGLSEVVERKPVGQEGVQRLMALCLDLGQPGSDGANRLVDGRRPRNDLIQPPSRLVRHIRTSRHFANS
jgi:hypothetical protein